MADKYVAGYLRVSSRSQRDAGDSPANQELRLREAGATVIYRDLAVSGFKLADRRRAEGFQRLWADIASGRVRRLLVTRLDRAARRDEIVIQLCEHCDANAVEFNALGSGAVDTGTAAGWLSVKMQLLIGEHYSRQLSENIRNGQRAAISRGSLPRPASTLPFHLARDPDSRLGAVPSPAWPDARLAIDRLLTQEWRASDVSRFIHERHGVMGHVASVGRWIRSGALAGDACDRSGRIVIPDCWPAITTRTEQQRLIEQAEASRSRWGHVSKMPPRALSGLCACANCGSTMVYHNAQGRYLYLRCQSCDVRPRAVPGDMVEQDLVGTWVLPRIEEVISQKIGSPLTESEDVAAWKRELKARKQIPEEFLTAVDRERITQLGILISESSRVETGSTAEMAVMALRLSDTTLGVNGWLSTPPMERNALLRTIVRRALVDTVKRLVTDVQWA